MAHLNDWHTFNPILVAAVTFFALLIVLLIPDSCMNYAPLDSTLTPVPSTP
jgi:hypothetical protein